MTSSQYDVNAHNNNTPEVSFESRTNPQVNSRVILGNPATHHIIDPHEYLNPLQKLRQENIYAENPFIILSAAVITHVPITLNALPGNPLSRKNLNKIFCVYNQGIETQDAFIDATINFYTLLQQMMLQDKLVIAPSGLCYLRAHRKHPTRSVVVKTADISRRQLIYKIETQQGRDPTSKRKYLGELTESKRRNSNKEYDPYGANILAHQITLRNRLRKAVQRTPQQQTIDTYFENYPKPPQVMPDTYQSELRELEEAIWLAEYTRKPVHFIRQSGIQQPPLNPARTAQGNIRIYYIRNHGLVSESSLSDLV